MTLCTAQLLAGVADTYRILAVAGKGGYGTVFVAEQILCGRGPVAIKEVKLADPSENPEQRARRQVAFNREITLLSRFSHPQIPHLWDYWTTGEYGYLVMDFVPGETLEAYLERRGGQLPLEEVLNIGIQLCTVLGYVHQQQPPIIFRDLKPKNIIRTPEGLLLLVDFGGCRSYGLHKSRDTSPLGTPGYAANEQYIWPGQRQTTSQTDIYGLGVVLLRLLTGYQPPETPEVVFPLAALLKGRPQRAACQRILRRMLAPQMKKRPASMAAVKWELLCLAVQHSRGFCQSPIASRSSAVTACPPHGRTDRCRWQPVPGRLQRQHRTVFGSLLVDVLVVMGLCVFLVFLLGLLLRLGVFGR